MFAAHFIQTIANGSDFPSESITLPGALFVRVTEIPRTRRVDMTASRQRKKGVLTYYQDIRQK